MMTDQEIDELEKMFPDAIPDCPYCLDDVNLTFLVAYKIGTNEKDLYFHINVYTDQFNLREEVWKWFPTGWKQSETSFAETRPFEG